MKEETKPPMEYYEKDGVFTAITSSREEMRQHLRDLAEVRKQRTQDRTEQVLRENGVFVGPLQTLQKMHDEIMEGKSSYPAHHQAELLLEAGRIGVWRTLSDHPHHNVTIKETAVWKESWGTISPYLRFVELCERLANEEPDAIGRIEGININELPKNDLMRLYIECKTWVNDYKKRTESHNAEKNQLFNRIKGLAQETHEMRTNRDRFSKMKLQFMVDKHLELELVVAYFRDFVKKVAKMEWGLARSEARLRELDEEEENPKSSVEDFLDKLKLTDDLDGPWYVEEKPKSLIEDLMNELNLVDDLEGTRYAEEFFGKIPTKPKKEVPISDPKANNLPSHNQPAQTNKFQACVEDDDSDTANWG